MSIFKQRKKNAYFLWTGVQFRIKEYKNIENNIEKKFASAILFSKQLEKNWITYQTISHFQNLSTHRQ